MNPATIYLKTDKGRAEITERQGALGGLQRRVLIMVDGKRSANALSAFVRVGELDGVLTDLLALGLIESSEHSAPLLAPAAPGFAAALPFEAPRAATTRPAFEVVRQQAANFVHERLGDAGEPICDAIHRCNSPDDLRKLLRGVEIFIGQRLSAETTQAFVRHFGALLL